MDKRIKEWWEEGAKGIFDHCLQHIEQRIKALKEFYDNVEEAIEEDVELVKDFHSDARKITEHIEKDVKDPYLKHRQKFFVICLKDYVFDLSFKMGQFSNINEVGEELGKQYEEVQNQMLAIKKRFENDDDSLNLGTIEEATELVTSIKALDEECAKMVEYRMTLEEERDSILDEMEHFIREKTEKLRIAEEEAAQELDD